MNPKARAFRQLQTNLANRSFDSFVKVIGELLAHHRHDFLKPLASAFRAREWDRVYREADSLSEQKYSDATSHFVANQFCLLIKKYPWPKEILDLGPRAAALKTFLSAEKRMGRINRKFAILYAHGNRDIRGDAAFRARTWIRSVIGPHPSYKRIFQKSDFGAGASVGVHGNATHLLAKLHSEKWSVTPGAIHHGFGGLLHNFHYMELLLQKNGLGVYCLDYEQAFDAYSRRIHVVQHNKISFVPKTAKTERTIAVEPLLNGYVQKGIDLVLREKLRKVGIDLHTQELNQRMAREGSSDDSDAGFVTIDLKSASDSVSIELCRYLFPDDWFRLFQRTRSPNYRLDGSGDTPYQKLCSMGNGFCFPIETLLFASACIASGAGRPGVDFMVYGDDIIVRKSVASELLALLAHWGFKTNTSKTFLEGPFRESCGADWFGGQDVRPYTLDHAFDTVENVFKFLNLSRRNERTEKFFHPVRQLVINLLPVQYQFFRPLPGQEDTGIDACGDELQKCPNARFSSRTMRWTWLELAHVPVRDENLLGTVQNEPWLIGIALRGASSVPHGMLSGLPGVTFRRIVRTKIVRKGYSSTSNWLPAPREP